LKFAHIADTHIRNLKFHYEYKTVFDKLYQALEDAAKTINQPKVDAAKNNIINYYNNTGPKDDASEANFAKVSAFKAKFDISVFDSKKIAVGDSYKTNNVGKIDTAIKALEDYYAANQEDVDSANSDASKEIADIKAQADREKDLIINAWKKDPLGAVDKDYVKSGSSDKYTDPERNKILQALRSSFTGLLSSKEIDYIAGLNEGILKEDPKALEFDDLKKLYDKPVDDYDKKPPGLTKTNLEIAKDIDKSLTNFINSLKDKTRARELRQAKIAYDAMVARSRGLTPSRTPEYSGTDRFITTTQIGGESRSPVDPVVFQSFERFFPTGANFNARVMHLKNFSEAVAEAASGNATKLNRYDAEEIFTGGNIMSLLSRHTRQIDASAGGTIVEAFLAFLVAGSKEGQSGGAADFVGEDGKNYSSKWSSLKSGSTQARSNFKTKHEIITYIFADKKSTKATSTKAGTSDVMSVTEMDIYLYDIITTKKATATGNSADYTAEGYKGSLGAFAGKTTLAAIKSAPNAQKMTYDSAGSSFNVKPPKGVAAIGTIKLVTADEEVFDDIFSKAISSITNAFARAAAKFNSESRKLQELTTTYTVSGDFSEGVAMADTYKGIKGLLQTIVTEKGISTTADIGLTENKKKSKKDLDNLIKEVILKRLLK